MVGSSLSRTVRMLIAYHNLDVPSVAGSVGMTPDTFYRRLKTGAWMLTEMVRLAAYFGIHDLDRFVLGRIDPALTTAATDASCMNSAAMTFDVAS